MLSVILAVAGIFVEAESFDRLGGWVVETQSVRQMGSAYLMAHGMGVPVADAEKTISIAQAGEYEVWARTRNWVEEWRPGKHPGRFELLVNGKKVEPFAGGNGVLGTNGKDWAWQLAGKVKLEKGAAKISLHDLTGFNGRCDQVALVPLKDGKWTYSDRPAESPIADAPVVRDLIVCGGGVAGICAALSASRYGLDVLLLQDRSMLGGCNSSEVRVSAGGFMHTGPYPALGNVLEEILPVRGDYGVLAAKFYEDGRKEMAFQREDYKASLKFNQFVCAVELGPAGEIAAVIARDMRSGRRTRYRAKLFVDATGDGTIARLAGCRTMYGREERGRWGEKCAPKKADRQVMGQTIQWTTEVASAPRPFPDIDWGLDFDESKCYYVRGGSWWQEAGQYRDMADETELIRDYGLLAIFSNWSYIKNHGKRKAEFARRYLNWMSPIGGKRESHRVIGDYVMTENDLENQVKFEDGTAAVTWDVDFHFPDPDNVKDFKEPFLSCAYHRGFGDPVAVPYRCLYAKDCANLFLAGRDISVSHGAFAAVRVQRTLGMLGEVVGIAAGICKERGCNPRAVYAQHLAALKERMRRGVPKFRDYVAFHNQDGEKYHFHDMGFVGIWPRTTNAIPARAERVIRSLEMDHLHKDPRLDGPMVIEVGTDKAIKTIEAALDKVREQRHRDVSRPIEVVIDSGDYAPAKPLKITKDLAATNFAALVLRAADFKCRPRLLGGVPVKGWKQTTFNGCDNVWCADFAASDSKGRPRLLFFNGRRMQPARWPNVDPARPFTSGFAFAKNDGKPMWTPPRFAPTGYHQDEFSFRPGEERRWTHPEDGWMILWPRHNWWNRTYDIMSVSNEVVRLKTAHKEIVDRLFPWDRWYAENIAEELDAPGEWYCDPRAKKVYFRTPDGSDPSSAVVTIAKGGPMLEVSGGNCKVIGLELTGGSQGVDVKNAQQIEVLGCSIHDIGFHDGSGVSVRGRQIRIADCDIFNIGSHGVSVHNDGCRKVDDRMDVAIENNYVHHCGMINSHGIGIIIYGQGVRVSHNLVHDMPRCGLFGYGRFCEISYNRVRHVNLTNDDTGAIYGGGWTVGVGTKVCYNWFSDSIGFQRQFDGKYLLHKGACGIYPDEGCGGLEVYGNLVEHCHHVAMHLHNGRWITISNNVFVSNGSLPVSKNTAQINLTTWNSDPKGYFVAHRRADIAKEYHQLVDADSRWLDYPALAQAPDTEKAFSSNGTTMMGVKVVNNIISYPDQGLGKALRENGINTSTNTVDRNLYWPGPTTNKIFKAGCDAHSIVADPLFRDAAKDDYRLRPESPAYKLGFKDIPYGKIGLRITPYRPILPHEAEGVREHPEWLKSL